MRAEHSTVECERISLKDWLHSYAVEEPDDVEEDLLEIYFVGG